MVVAGGFSETPTAGDNRIDADEDLVGSATLVAVRVTVCEAFTFAGAVYLPDGEMLPTGGDKDQLTLVYKAPVTTGVN
jgi:hypothetical protein